MRQISEITLVEGELGEGTVPAGQASLSIFVCQKSLTNVLTNRMEVKILDYLVVDVDLACSFVGTVLLLVRDERRV